MSDDVIFISILFSIMAYFFIKVFYKSLGKSVYTDPEEQKRYQEWLKKEGIIKRWVAIVNLALIVIGWIWVFKNLN